MKTLIAAILSLGIILPGFAGEKGNPEDRANHLMDILPEDLSLTESQTTQLNEELVSFFTDARALREGATEGDKEAIKEEMKGLKDGFSAGLEEFLSAEQVDAIKATMEQLHQGKKKRERFADMSVEEINAERVEGMTKHLGLSEDQATEISAIFNSKAKTMESLREQTEKNAEAIEALRGQIEAEIIEVLTEEQLVKFEEGKAKREAASKH